MKESPSQSIKLISTESQSKPSSRNSTPDTLKKESNLIKDLTVDPFNIQFDGLIENKGNKDNEEYEDNNNDVMSLLNCWN